MDELGYELQLGHLPGDGCPVPGREIKAFLVMHTNGLHKIRVRYCACRPYDYYNMQQVLDVGWWPATPLIPECAATEALMRLNQSLMTSGSVNAQEMCQTLAWISDPSGKMEYPVSFNSTPL